MIYEKSYNPESFYKKKKKSRRFVVLTFNNRNTVLIAGVLCFAIFILTAFNVFATSKEKLVEKGVEHALGFLCRDIKQENIDLKMVLKTYVSSFLVFKEPENKPNSVEKIKLIPKKQKTEYFAAVEIKNETDYAVEPLGILGEEIVLKTENPKVLIVHTHGSESYTPSEKYQYTHSGNYRTQDENFNVLKVGEHMAEALKAKGIEVIHDKTINDYPSYNDSYNKTGRIIQKHLNADPGITFVFDIHRDAVGSEDNIVKFVSKIDGRDVAQVMTVCGTDTNLSHPGWEDNLALAVHIQSYFDINYPGFMRPVNLRKERFNMHLSSGSLLFEIGTNGNTLDEALLSAEILGEGIGDFINNLKKS